MSDLALLNRKQKWSEATVETTGRDQGLRYLVPLRQTLPVIYGKG